MKSSELIGILIIGNSLVVAFWWIASQRPHTLSVTLVCGLAVFAGLACLLSDRISEVTLEKIGTIRTAAQQVAVDAAEVSTIKQRIEAQSATVDLVAKKAAEAQRLAESLDEKNTRAEKKLVDLEDTLSKASMAVSALERLVEFNDTLIAAKTEDRMAFDKLEAWGNDQSYKYHQRAKQAWIVILNEHAMPLGVAYSVPWRDGIDPSRLYFPELVRIFDEAPVVEAKLGIIQYMQGRADLTKHDKLEFFFSILDKHSNLQVVAEAGKAFASVADLKIKPLAVDYFRDWWREHEKETRVR